MKESVINKTLTETALSRVYKHFTDSNYPVVILSAFRGGKKYEVNHKNNEYLAAKIQNLGYGYIFVDGYWVEKNDKGEAQHVKEESILVIGDRTSNKGNPISVEQFQKEMLELASEYDQEAILFKNIDGTVGALKPDGTFDNYGTFHPNKLGFAYTKLKGNGERTFMFESEREQKGWMERMLDKAKERDNNEK